MTIFKPSRKLGHIAALALLTSSSSIALAQNDSGQDGKENGDWEFTLAPLFLWGMGINGDATTGNSTAPLNVEFKDIWDNLEGIFTLHFEARKDKWTIFSEIQYADLGPEVTLNLGPAEAVVDIGFKNTMFELGGAYAFRETQNTRWELLGGIRYTDQDLDVDATLAFPDPDKVLDIEMKGGDNWTHAIVGTRFFGTMSDEWTFVARTDVGYGGSDNKAFNAMALFDYRFNHWGSVFFGYRYLKYDYDNEKATDTYAYDAYQTGPIAGLAIHW